MKIGKLLLILTAAFVPLALCGCTGDAGNTNTAQTGGDDHGHSHSHEEGPNGGHLIELGGEKYHLEWLHDDEAKTLTFYVLDAEGKNEVPIAAENIAVNFSVDGATKTFEVPAVREEGATETAKFEITDEDLYALITADEAEATVVLDINGESFEGEIEHHDHHH